jgi:hypothetical protein
MTEADRPSAQRNPHPDTAPRGDNTAASPHSDQVKSLILRTGVAALFISTQFAGRVIIESFSPPDSTFTITKQSPEAEEVPEYLLQDVPTPSGTLDFDPIPTNVPSIKDRQSQLHEKLYRKKELDSHLDSNWIEAAAANPLGQINNENILAHDPVIRVEPGDLNPFMTSMDGYLFTYAETQYVPDAEVSTSTRQITSPVSSTLAYTSNDLLAADSSHPFIHSSSLLRRESYHLPGFELTIFPEPFANSLSQYCREVILGPENSREIFPAIEQQFLTDKLNACHDETFT